jgi:fumarate reductase flavoprotein subunit
MDLYDVCVIGAGTAGMPAAGFAAERGLSTIVVEADDRIGGTLHLSSGQMSAGGTRLQAAKGIEDSAQDHFDDIMRISRGTANPEIARLAVDHAADTIHWLLDLGFEMLPEMPVIMYGHEPYLKPRTYWGADGGRTILEAIRPWFEAKVCGGAIDLRLKTQLLGLRAAENGAIEAAIVAGRDGERSVIRAKQFILTTGGYTASHSLFSQFHGGRPLYPMGAAHSQGEGMLAGVGVGGYVRGGEMFLPTFGGVADPDRPGYFGTGGVILTPQHRQPWEIWVNDEGERYVREDIESIDARERKLLEQPLLRFYVVFDQAILDAAPSLSMEEGKGDYRSSFGSNPDYMVAPSLSALAEAMGVPSDRLGRSVADYNRGQAAGEDAFGRVHMPLPIAQAPYYAIRFYGTSVKSYAGLAVDDRLRVVRPSGDPIPNLYAAGEVLGGAAFTGNSFCGGMSVTPALALGRLLGRTISCEN